MWLGIDWGGTYIKAGLVDQRNRLFSREIYNSSELKTPSTFIKKIEQLVAKFGSNKIKAIGIGAPGIVNIPKGFIYYLPNVEGWRNYPLKKNLQEKLSLPVFVNNDANLFALSEARLGAAKNCTRAIFLTLGTGLGSAVIHQGHILQGDTSAGELAHVPVNLRGNKCGCGGHGCIETCVGNNYLLKRYQQLKPRSSSDITVKDIYYRAKNKEKTALKLWDEFSYCLGMFLSGMINIFNPQKIIFGGGVSGAYQIFKPRLLEVIKQQALWPHLRGLKLVKARVNNPGIIGAALYAKESMRK
jgi:glucokinase